MTDETFQDIIDRVESARDRYGNAGNEQAMSQGQQALASLRSLDPSQLDEARQIEGQLNPPTFFGRLRSFFTRKNSSRLDDETDNS